MSETSTEPAAVQSRVGPISILGDLLAAPTDAFRAILARPTVLVPLALVAILSVGFTAIWIQNVDFPEMQKNQFTDLGVWEKMPPEARAQVLESKPGVMVWLMATVFPLLGVLVLAGLFLLVYRFFYGGDVRFRQSLSIAAWTSAITSLVATPLMLLVFYLKGDWSIPPDQILQANLTLLLDKESVHKVLWSLAKSIDAFTLWFIFLLSTGFGLASRRPLASAMWGVLIPWLLLVAAKMGLAAIF